MGAETDTVDVGVYMVSGVDTVVGVIDTVVGGVDPVGDVDSCSDGCC